MGALQPSNPSVSLVLSQNSYPFRLPAYRVSHLRRYHPYPRSKLTRALDFDDPLAQMTTDACYDGPRLDHLLPTIPEEDTDGVDDAKSSEDGRLRVWSLSLSTFSDLVSTVRRRLERLRVIRKENEVQFDMLT